MTEQPTFADLEYQHKKRQTRREVFLKRIDSLIPWERLEERIRPHYFKAERGRRPYPLSAMLRVHIVQLCYNVSDPGMEDLLYEAESVSRGYGCLSRFLMRVPSCTFATCWKSAIWDKGCLRRSTSIWRPKVCGSGKGP